MLQRPSKHSISGTGRCAAKRSGCHSTGASCVRTADRHHRRRTGVGVVSRAPAEPLRGIRSVILERHTRDYVQARIRAGILEQGMVSLLRKAKASARMDREGTARPRRHRADVRRPAGSGSTSRRSPVANARRDGLRADPGSWLKDPVRRRAERRQRHASVFEGAGCRADRLTSTARRNSTLREGRQARARRSVTASPECDGYHGASRESVPRTMITEYERTYPRSG